MNGVDQGRRGEDLAVVFLLENGYRILERNWRQKTGEVDIIAKRGRVLVFCEVKSRSSKCFGSGAEAVGRRKQEHIIRTALLYMQKFRLTDTPCRFDIIEVMPGDKGQAVLNHIENAFGL